MSTFRAPSERRSVFNPTFYAQDSNLTEDDRLLIDDIETNGALNSVAINSTVLPGIQTLTTTKADLSYVDKMDLTSVIKLRKSSNSFNPFGADTRAYWDFSDPNDLGRDSTGNFHLKPNGTVEYLATSTRTHCANFIQPTDASWSVETYLTSSSCLKNETTQATPILNTTQFTMSCWVYRNNANRASIFSCASPLADWKGLVWFNINSTGQLNFYQEATGNDSANGTSVIPVGQWCHVAVTKSTSGGVTFYINGVLDPISSQQTNGVTATGLLLMPHEDNLLRICVGGLVTLPAHTLLGESVFRRPMRGRLSDLFIANREYTQPEINQLFSDDYGSTLILLFGQSNMVGRDTFELSIDGNYSLTTNVQQFNTKTNIPGYLTTPVLVSTVTTAATNPLNHPDGSSGNLKNGLWLNFCNDLVRYGGVPWRRKILLVPGARGGTSLSVDWKTGTGLCYKTGVIAVNAAMALNKNNGIGALLWNQGESDVVNPFQDYKANFNAMLSGFQTEIQGFNKTTVPVIMSELSQWANEAIIDTATGKRSQHLLYAAMQSLCLDNPNFRMIATRDQNPKLNDTQHWTSASLRIFGTRYYDAFADVLGLKSKPTTGNMIIFDEKTRTAEYIGITKAMVGLSSVSNTSDADKPISTLTKAYVDTKVSGLVNSAPETLDTLSELATALGNDVNFATTVSTSIGLRAPLASPSFTGTVSGVTKAMVELGNVTNTSDADKPVSSAQQTQFDARLLKHNGISTGFSGFFNIGAASGQAHPWFGGGAGVHGAICTNLLAGDADLSFLNVAGVTTGSKKSFTWWKYTTATEKTLLASISNNGEFDVPGTITGPTITDLKDRVDALESSSASTSFYRLAADETKVETNATLKHMYFADVNGGHETLTLPTLTAGDSKFNGWVVTIRTIKDGFSTLIVNVPAGTSTFVGLAPTWDTKYYTTKTWNTTATVQYLTVGGNYYELFTQNTAAPAPYP